MSWWGWGSWNPPRAVPVFTQASYRGEHTEMPWIYWTFCSNTICVCYTQIFSKTTKTFSKAPWFSDHMLCLAGVSTPKSQESSAEPRKWALSPHAPSTDPEELVRSMSTWSPEWTQAIWAQLFQAVFPAITAEEAGVPQVKGQSLYCPWADLAQISGQQEPTSHLYPLVVLT